MRDLSTLFIIGLFCIPIGIASSHIPNNVQEFVYDYTDCISQEEAPFSCAFVLQSREKDAACTCVIPITLKDDFEGDVYIYYGLNTLTLKRKDSNPVPVLNTGIACPSEKLKFRNPPNSQNNLSEVYKDYVKPPNWKKNIWELDRSNPDNNGLQNEDLIVWITTAALPTFRKLYRRLNRTAEGYNSGLKAGNYTLHVEYNYPVHSFGGRKLIIISTTSLLCTTSWLGAIKGLVVGLIVLLIGIGFLIRYLKYGKSNSEMNNVLTPRSPNQ